jgi:3-oxoacyl-[acyl-carrier protein] reductase
VVVTGASRGIGRACALHLSQAGYRVVLCYATGQDAAEKVAEGICAAKGEHAAITCALDLALGPEAITAAVEQLLRRIGSPWALVHNAGISKDGLLTLSSFDTWHQVLEVNLLSFWALMRPMARAMLKARQGRIVTMASVAGQRGNAGQAAYAASKAGLIGASKSLALELAPRGITVNAVAPGFIQTDMTAKLDAETLEGHVPMRRLGRPEEVAAVVGFLCSQAASYITGEVLGVHGGLYT